MVVQARFQEMQAKIDATHVCTSFTENLEWFVVKLHITQLDNQTGNACRGRLKAPPQEPLVRHPLAGLLGRAGSLGSPRGAASGARGRVRVRTPGAAVSVPAPGARPKAPTARNVLEVDPPLITSFTEL